MDESLQSGEAESGARHEITRILMSAGTNGSDAVDAVIPLIYEELRGLAAYRLAQEKPGQTLQATALVNEVYLRLLKDVDVHFENKRHFFVAAAEAMRRILIENARRKNAKKRGGEWHRTELDVSCLSVNNPSDEVLELHEVLDQFAEIDPEGAELVKLRFFAGLTQQQCADLLGISRRTADNRWAFARAWLFRAIQEQG